MFSFFFLLAHFSVLPHFYSHSSLAAYIQFDKACRENIYYIQHIAKVTLDNLHMFKNVII